MPWINGEEVLDHELPSSWTGASSYESFMDTLDWRKREAWEKVTTEVAVEGYAWPTLEKDEFGCLWPSQTAVCAFAEPYHRVFPAGPCHRIAGYGTAHEGVGMCNRHGGYYGRGKNEGAVLMAILFAEEMNVTPWEALLSQVRLLANQVRWLQLRVQWAEQEGGADAIKPDGAGWHWVCMLEARGDRLAKVSKMAIDAGVAERLVRQVELEVDHMVTAAMDMMDWLGIHGQQRDAALERMAGKLQELEAGEKV